MADIKINDIKPAGADLFGDSESFLNELTTVDELSKIVGGTHKPTTKLLMVGMLLQV